MENERSRMEIPIVPLLFCVVVICVFYYRWRRRRVYELMKKNKMPPGLPIVGHTLSLLMSKGKLINVLDEYISNYGPNVAMWLFHIPLICIGKPEDLEISMQSQDCLSKGYFYEFSRFVVGEGLFTAPVEKWRKHRKIIQPMFSSKILNGFIPIFASTGSTCVNEILPKYVAERNVDWFRIFTSASLDTVCQTTMGVNTDFQRSTYPIGKNIQRGTCAIFSRAFNVFLHPEFIFQFTKQAREIKETMKNFKVLARKVIADKKEELRKRLQPLERHKNDSLEKKVSLELLLEFDPDGTKFTEDELLDEIFTFFVGGIDTSALTVSFFLSMMGMHQDIQEKVYNEITENLDPERIPTMDELNKLELLERCLKETLRIFTPVAAICRRVGNKEIQLSDSIVPAGSFIIFPLFSINRSPHYWDNPLKFDPDRFLPEFAAKRHPYSFLPFSGGLRNCIGIRYTYLNLKILTSMILRKYKIHCDYKCIEEIELVQQVKISPVHGYKFHLEERK